MTMEMGVTPCQSGCIYTEKKKKRYHLFGHNYVSEQLSLLATFCFMPCYQLWFLLAIIQIYHQEEIDYKCTVCSFEDESSLSRRRNKGFDVTVRS